MSTLLIAVGAFVGFLIAYHTYGRYLARRIFKLDPDATVPSVALNDDRDYVPTKRGIVFGHHFTSIAGTGPIVGPAIAVIWGWLPALLWVVFGSILIGAVHDFGALVVSLRNRGQTVGDIAGRVLNPRVRLLFLFVLFLALTIVIAIFGLVIAAVFRMYPTAIFPCVVQIPLAVAIGLWLHRKGVNLTIPSLIALALMYLSVVYGDWGPLHAFNQTLSGWPIFTWVVVLLLYSYIASVLPVWTLLQPRDYINSLQLLTALALIVVGLTVAAIFGGAPVTEGGERGTLEIIAPLANFNPAQAPLIFPFLFITIACGAISGFHCLVSSGTSSKQLQCESDAQFVGYGSMLTEGFLAVLVILACVAGLGLGTPLRGTVANDGAVWVGQYVGSDGVKREIDLFRDGAPGDDYHLTRFGQQGEFEDKQTGELEGAGSLAGGAGLFVGSDRLDVKVAGRAAYNTRYESWGAAGSLGAKVGAFVDGAANFLKAMGIPVGVATALMGVLVASFAATTLDTACRLQRYVVQELAGTVVRPPPQRSEVKPARPGLNPISWLTNKHAATIFAILIAGFIAAIPPAGKDWSWAHAGLGGMLLWPMFGATNQLLGGLAFLVIGFWLWRRKLPVWFIVPPMLFMLLMPAWALIWQMFISNPAETADADAAPGWLFAETPNYALIIIALATLALEVWMIIEAIIAWPRARGVLEEALPPLRAPAG